MVEFLKTNNLYLTYRKEHYDEMLVKCSAGCGN